MKGTVYPRPSVKDPVTGVKRPVKGSTWTYAFSVDSAAGRRQVTKGGYTTRKACEAALAEALVEHGRSPGHVIEPSKQRVGEFLQQWLDGRTTLKKSTRSSYQRNITNLIVPFIGDVRLCDLTAPMVTKLYRTIRERGGFTRTGISKAGGDRRRQDQPLSESSVHKVHVILSGALGYAARKGYVRVNPMTLIDREDRPRQRSADTPEMRTWTADEAATFLEAIAEDRWAPIYDLDLNTGLRCGELAGLRWADVHLDGTEAYLVVRNNRVPVDYVMEEGTTKSKKGRRVGLDAPTVAVLRRWRSKQLEELMAIGVRPESGYVFTDQLGEALHAGTIRWHFGRLTKVAGVPTIRLHDLRHTHATLGLAAGVPLKVMSERLGHASTQITADLYQHVVPGMDADAAAKIGGLLRRAQ